jgi:nucleotide-binding universal stress UspA family protein
MPKTVIVPLDGSDYALRGVNVATRLAGAFDAELVLVTTPMTTTAHAPSEVPVWLSEAARASGYERARVELATSNNAVTAIEGCIASADAPALCMATHGRGALGTAVLGSVAQRVVCELRVQTALVGPNFDTAWGVHGPLLVCHDGSARSNAILPSAREWAALLGSNPLSCRRAPARPPARWRTHRRHRRRPRIPGYPIGGRGTARRQGSPPSHWRPRAGGRARGVDDRPRHARAQRYRPSHARRCGRCSNPRGACPVLVARPRELTNECS